MFRSPMLCLLIGLFALLSAQVLPVGTVDGTVKDPSSALLTGIKVTLKNVDTGVSRDATTNESGYFFFPLIQPGRYEVSVEKAGFKKGTQEVLVQTGKRSTADFTLELGQITESVQVTGQAALLETSTAGVSRNIQRKVIEDLPLLGRNPMQLIQLSAGITNNYGTGASNLTDISTVSYSSVNGANNRQNEFLLDGIPNNVSDRVAFIPTVDNVEEFTVQTNALDAEYGHGGGMYVNISTRGGTNELHGHVFEYLQNDKLNANSFFNNMNGVKRPAFRFNQFGAAVGGPVVKNKVFWFFDWQSVRQRTPYNNIYTVATALQRQGDFSQTFDASGKLMQIADPLTTRSNNTRDLFSGNFIPASRINSIGAKVAQAYPLPNLPGVANSGVNNYVASLTAPWINNTYSIRADPNINRHRLFARWSRNNALSGTPAPYNIGPPTALGQPEGNNRVQTSVGLSDAFTVSPTMVITAQTGYTRWTQEGLHPNYDLTSLGFSPSLVSQLQEQIFPQFNNSDVGFVGASEGQWFEHTNTYSLNIGATKMHGSHNMKWGYQMQIKQNNSVPANAPGGSYSFNRGFTQPNAIVAGTNQGNGIASLLLGYPASGSVDLRAWNAAQGPFYGFYFQDDYKVTQKLSLNIGLRYDLLLGTTERFNRNTVGFNPDVVSPIAAQAQANYAASPIPELAASNFKVMGGMMFATPGSRRNSISDTKDWGPRFGVAYRLLPRTVLRTGIGVFYSEWWQPFVQQAGFSSTTTMITSNDGGLTPANTLTNPFPLGLVQPPGSSQGYATLLGQNLGTLYDYYRVTPRNLRWSFGFQQEVAKDLSVEVNYVGQRGTRLPIGSGSNDNSRPIDYLPQQYYALGSRLNTKIPNPFLGLIPANSTLGGSTITISQLLQRYPEFAAISLQRNTQGDSSYHSLQVTANKRFGKGLLFQGAYTFSRQIEQLRYIEPSDPAPAKMIGQFDNPHRLTVAAIYELPFGKGKPLGGNNPALDKIIGGWQWNALYMYQTGPAIFLPAAVATGISPKISNPTISDWFNLASMTILPAFTPRRIPFEWNDLRQDHINNWDMSFMKNTPVFRERIRLQFRCELINAFNRKWLGQPTVDPSSGSYGRIASTSNSPRNIQFGLRVNF